MATNKEKTVVEETTATATEQVTIEKSQLDEILAGYEDMKTQIAKLSEQSMTNGNTAEARSLAEEKRLLAIVEEANKASDELVPYYADLGATRSNKNLEVSINGVQTIVPKGQSVKLKKSVVEVIENAKKQKEISLGLQETRNKEAEKAETEGGIY